MLTGNWLGALTWGIGALFIPSLALAAPGVAIMPCLSQLSIPVVYRSDAADQAV